MLSTKYTLELVSRHLSFIKQLSLAITLEHVFENLIEDPPTPQNPSRIVSHLILLAMCSAIAYGVTLSQD